MSDDVLKCDLCKKSFSGVVPYSQHLKSVKHLKKKKQIELEAIITLPVSEEGKLCCNLCNMKFSGVIPFQQHMNGSTHTKNVRRQEVMKDICHNLNSNSKQSGFRTQIDKKYIDDGYFSYCNSSSSSSSGGIGGSTSSMNSSRLNPNNSCNSSSFSQLNRNAPKLDPGVELQKQLHECSKSLQLSSQGNLFNKREIPKESIPFPSKSGQWDSGFQSTSFDSASKLPKESIPFPSKSGQWDSGFHSTSFDSASNMCNVPKTDSKIQGCTLCGISSFKNQEEIIRHLESDEHFIQKLKNLQLGDSSRLSRFSH